MTRSTIVIQQIARCIAVICTLVAALVVSPTPSRAAATLSPIQFTAQVLHTTSPARSLRFSGVGSSVIIISGDFAQTNRCSGGSRGWTCDVMLTFQPSVSGSRSGTLLIGDMRTDLAGYGLDPVQSIQTIAAYQRIIAPYIVSRAHLQAMQYIAEHSNLEPFRRELQIGRDMLLYQQVNRNLALVQEADACLQQVAKGSSMSTSCNTILVPSIRLFQVQLNTSIIDQSEHLAANVLKAFAEATDNIVKNLGGECSTSEC